MVNLERFSVRTEKEIFALLEELSLQDGFWEVVAFFCWKDTFLHIVDQKLDEKALAQQFDRTKLSRTELSTLIGLASKTDFVAKQLSFDELKERAGELWAILEELHQSFYLPIDFSRFAENVTADKPIVSPSSLFKLIQGGEQNSFMREAIFYGGDGAFKHQYRDLARRRYINDNDWLIANKGFNIDQAAVVISAIDKVQLQKVNRAISESRSWPLPYHLPVFMFNLEDVCDQCGLEKEIVEAVISAFATLPKVGMDCFKTVDDFNHRNAFPIMIAGENTYISFQSYALWESLYESPFFWFGTDKKYNVTASKNRGTFTESFSAERLASVFGEENVQSNLDIYDGKNKIGEIDVLVTFGAFAIVVQAKSKKLTIEARKGNSQQLKSDFKNAIQDAYDQAYLCSEALIDGSYTLKDANGLAVNPVANLKTVFPMCVVSEYFPALAAQAREFLNYQITSSIKHPYVMDVFLLDMITEILPSPLWVLDYFMKRSDFGNSIVSNHELVTLSIYIKQNLFFDEKADLVMLDDDISADLEFAMLVRREGVEGKRTPDGFLTAHKNTHVGSIITDIEHSKDYARQMAGFHLLSLSGQSVKSINNAISKMITQSNLDGRHHDIALPLIDVKSGLIIHFNEDDHETAYKRLITHCEKRKYACKANSWIGLCFSPRYRRLRFASYHESEWAESPEMDELVADLKPFSSMKTFQDNYHKSSQTQPERTRQKVGRNDPCPCGSGVKYKRCCL